ncbi:MAG: glycoside hydrolase family 3 C-terminal domain-containing protein [Bacteroidaceae bacterium]|nr:glycoside hydrolase family 3 C-terminal domain-containing protein [Bacteroidaceae bacterium]
MKRKTYLSAVCCLMSILLASAQKKTFAVHYNTMVGTSTDEIRFSQNGDNDEWAPGDIYYPNKDLSQIQYISRYFPCSNFTFSLPDLVMQPGEKAVVDIDFQPEESVVRYVDKFIHSSNSNVAKAVRLGGAQFEVTAVSAGYCTLTATHNEAGQRTISVLVKSDEAYVDRMVDSLLNLMTDDEKFSLVGGTNWYHTKSVDRLDIPGMEMCDGPQGVGSDNIATAYPPNQALAATWNRDMAQRYGRSIARDCKARGINIILGPGVNIYRSPLCGRNFEYMGEDPYLAGQTAANYIIGAQREGISTTVKHFLGNNSDYDRDHISNDMDERTLHEIYLPAFKAAVQEGKTGCLMTSYNLVNGIYTTHSRQLLTDILRDKWGYKGIVMSDWGSTHDCLGAAWGGLDLEMASADHMTPDSLRLYIARGQLSMSDIETKVRHILHTMISMGFHDEGQQDNTIPLFDPESDSTALAAYSEAVTLLRNENNLLPIDTSSVKHIVVTGKNATGYVSGGGSGNVNPWHYVSTFNGIRALGDSLGIEVDCKDRYDLLPAIIFADEELTQPGFKAEYFSTSDLSGSPLLTQTETKINYIWSAGGPDVEGIGTKNYSVRWSGYISVPASATYTFTAGGDDGFRLLIDGTTVLDDWAASSYHTKTASKLLSKTKVYAITFEYYQLSGDAMVNLSWKKNNDNKDYLAEYLKDADLVVACIGMNSSIEGEGHDRSFELPNEDKEVLSSIAKAARPTVVIVNGGGAVEMVSWQEQADAILWGYYGGQQGGTAIADILFGRTNPSGHLPITIERAWSENPTYNSYHDPDGDKHVSYSEGIFMGYRGYDKLGRQVLYPFGHGLSYTTFSIDNLIIGEQQEDGNIEVSCTLTNTGNRDGAQVVQLYVGREGECPVERPLKELRDFAKVFLRAGESQRVTFNLKPDAFTYYDVNQHDFIYDAGQYSIMLGFSSRDIQQSSSTTLKPLP